MADPQIKYDIVADVKGTVEVEALAQQLDALANTLSGKLQAKAKAAAAALRELGSKNKAIADFTGLKRGAIEAAQALKEAQAAAQKMGASIAASGQPTQTQIGQMRKLAEAVRAAKANVQQNTAALDVARATLNNYGIGTKNLELAQRRLHAGMKQAVADNQALAQSYERSASAASASAATQVRAHRQIGTGVESISAQLSRLQKYVGLFYAAGRAGSMIKEVTDTADAYNNLGARIKLVTGDGEQFKETFAAIGDLAQRTSSDLEQTGTLFTRLATAGKSAGLATKDAIDQALGLTESINQAIQLSGGSAESANAAITQLIQGLQSGVLRGQEFNSVMEQSPRLAKALADGLGVTIGELRKMANAGSLTTEVVVGALKSQSAALQEEFKTLPVTVGRAMTNLSSSWTMYVGEVDKAKGVSEGAAKAINLLTNNLDTLGAALKFVGEVGLAFYTIKLARYFYGVASAAKVAAVEVVGASASMTAANAASTATAASVGRLASAFKMLRAASYIGILFNAKEIGTWIGESAAKLMGYKDRSKELEEQEKRLARAQKQRTDEMAAQQAQIQANINKTFDLSKAASAAIAEFDGLTKSGKSASDALGAISKNFDVQSVQGIRDAAGTLDKLFTDNKINVEQFQATWSNALKGQDLAVFQTNAQAAFAGSAREAERMAQVLDVTTREAIRRAGLDFDLISGGMSAASQSAINDAQTIIDGLASLKQQGVDTGLALSASLGKAINTADSQAALEAVKGQIEQVRQVLGDKVADGLLEQAAQKARELNAALDVAKPGINSLAEAMKQLGIISDESLRNTAQQSLSAYETMREAGTASARELAAGFQKAAADAIAANNGIAPSWVQAQAAARGFAITTDAAGKQTVQSMQAARKATEEVGVAARHSAQGYDQMAGSAKSAAEAAEEAAAAERKRRGVDKQGFAADSEGNRIVAGTDIGTLTGVYNFLKAAGVDDEGAARDMAKQFIEKKQRAIKFGNWEREFGKDQPPSVALLKMAESYTFSDERRPRNRPEQAQPPSQPSQPQRAATNNVVNINLGGRNYSVPTTDGGARQLLDALKAAKQTAVF